MTDQLSIPFQTTLEVRDSCLCLHTQRAARALARRFDAALRPSGLTNEQFSLLMSLNRPEPPTLGAVASLLGADRTTLTAAVKTLERHGLATSRADADDGRVRRIALTDEGRRRLIDALPVWRAIHAAIESELADGDRLRRELNTLAAVRTGTPARALCDQ